MSHLFSKLAVRFLINIFKARFSSNITKHQLTDVLPRVFSTLLSTHSTPSQRHSCVPAPQTLRNPSRILHVPKSADELQEPEGALSQAAATGEPVRGDRSWRYLRQERVTTSVHGIPVLQLSTRPGDRGSTILLYFPRVPHRPLATYHRETRIRVHSWRRDWIGRQSGRKEKAIERRSRKEGE